MNLQTTDDIANDIRMQRHIWQGSYLLVEGRDDKLFMEPYIDRDSCRTQVVQGKEIVCEVLNKLNRGGVTGVLGLIDADLDRIRPPDESRSNVIMPEHHDLETMLLSSRALDRVLAEFASQTKMADFSDNTLDALLERALPLACLRLASAERGLNLRFNKLRYSYWVEKESLEVNIDKMIIDVRNKSSRHDLSVQELRYALDEVRSMGHSQLEICNGHDLIEILAFALRTKLGSNSSKAVDANILRRSLRLAYSEHEFISSPLHRQVRSWEEQSQGFRVLKDATQQPLPTQ